MNEIKETKLKLKTKQNKTTKTITTETQNGGQPVAVMIGSIF